MPGTPVPVAAYEPADVMLFSPAASGELFGKPYEIGTPWLLAGTARTTFGLFAAWTGSSR